MLSKCLRQKINTALLITVIIPADMVQLSMNTGNGWVTGSEDVLANRSQIFRQCWVKHRGWQEKDIQEEEEVLAWGNVQGQSVKMVVDPWPCLRVDRSGIRQVKSEEYLQATVTTTLSPNAPSPRVASGEPGWLRVCIYARYLNGRTTDWFALTQFWTSKVLFQKKEEENGWNKNTSRGQKRCSSKNSPSFVMIDFL